MKDIDITSRKIVINELSGGSGGTIVIDIALIYLELVS